MSQRLGTLFVALLLAAVCAAPAHAASPRPLVAAWAMAPQAPGALAPAIAFNDEVGGRTVRNLVRVTLDGTAVRIRLSNELGSRPLTIDDVRVARSAGHGATSGVSQRLTFGGRTHVTIAVGRQVASDVAPMRIHAGEELAVSLYSAGSTGTVTNGGSLFHTSYVSSPGDTTGSSSAAGFPSTTKAWLFLTGVDVRPASRGAGAIAIVGASVDFGYASTPDAYRGYADILARRLHRNRGTRNLSVVNTSIAGNNLREDTGCFGESGLHRLARDAFAQPGVREVVLADGGNDLIHPHEPPTDPLYPCVAHTPTTAKGMIAAYKRAIARIHAHHLRAILVTLTVIGRYKYWTPAIERQRRTINRWIRTSALPDAVIDLEPVWRDPRHPTWLRPAYDSGDGVHPNDRGHAALGRAIDLSIFNP